MTDDHVIVRVTVRGRVQGVGYRAWVEDQATLSGLDGWVRNRQDGSVEAVLAGSSKDVAEMVAMCWRGPRASRVDAVAQGDANEQDLGLRRPGEDFSVLPTV